MAASHVVVDGSNIATEGRNRPSLKQLDEAVQAFLEEHPHDKCTVVVDATFGHRIEKREAKAFEDALEAGEIIMPPAGAIGRGDAFVLEIADKVGANVFSNDSFQEFHGTYEWLFDEGRLIGGKPVPDVGWVFLHRAPVRGPASRRARRDTRTDSDDTDKKGRSRRGRGRGRGGKDDAKAGTAPGGGSKGGSKPAKRAGSKPDGDKRRTSKKVEPINEPLVFIEFVADHPVGTAVQGVVKEFSSHGAYVDVDGARCYVPMKLMSDPAPRSPRDVLSQDQRGWFVVEEFDAPRRSIDLAVPGMQTRPTEELPRPAQKAAAEETPHVDAAPPGDRKTQEAKVRIHELAKRLDRPSKDVVAAAKELGLQVKSHSSSVDPDQADRIAAALEKQDRPARSSGSKKKAPAKKTAARKSGSAKKATKKAAPKKAGGKKAAPRKAAGNKAAPKKKAAAKKDAADRTDRSG